MSEMRLGHWDLKQNQIRQMIPDDSNVQSKLGTTGLEMKNERAKEVGGGSLGERGVPK